MGKVINTTTANLKEYKRAQLEKVKNAVADTAVAIELEATRKAPKFISIEKRFSEKGFTAEVGVKGNNEMSAYIEFGTGLSAVSILAPYPQWVKDIAMEFYINGKGTLTGKPYFYPAVFKNEKILNQELKEISDENVSDK
jgi:hypothetical protein